MAYIFSLVINKNNYMGKIATSQKVSPPKIDPRDEIVNFPASPDFIDSIPECKL